MKEDRNLISIFGHVGRNIMGNQPFHTRPHIGYTRVELTRLRYNNLNGENTRMQHITDWWTCVTVRSLRLNRRQRLTGIERGRRAGTHVRNKSDYFNSSSYNNLCKIPIKIDKDLLGTAESIKITTINAESIWNKDHLLREYTDDIQSDIVVISESWLTNEDTPWINQSELNKDGWRL